MKSGNRRNDFRFVVMRYLATHGIMESPSHHDRHPSPDPTMLFVPVHTLSQH